MKRLVITETDAGQWIVETSAGVRTFGASLDTALDKMHPPLELNEETPSWAGLKRIFGTIQNIRTGQIGHGQASG